MGTRTKLPDPAYTSENICRALGLDGFADDPLLSQARQAVRLLLPSFHNEACLSFVRTDEDISLSIVAAQSRVWQEDGPSGTLEPATCSAMPVSTWRWTFPSKPSPHRERRSASSRWALMKTRLKLSMPSSGCAGLMKGSDERASLHQDAIVLLSDTATDLP